MVVDVRFPPVLLVYIPMRDVNVVHSGVIVVVRMSGKEMAPVLPLMQVVGDVVVLVPMLHRVMCVVTLRPGHPAHLSHWQT